jgi:hypothetical protein
MGSLDGGARCVTSELGDMAMALHGHASIGCLMPVQSHRHGTRHVTFPLTLPGGEGNQGMRL